MPQMKIWVELHPASNILPPEFRRWRVMMHGDQQSVHETPEEAEAAAASYRLRVADGPTGTKKSSAKPTSRRERKPHAKGPARAAMAPEELRRIRKALKLTQQQFAEAVGVQPLTIGLWEGGKTPISKSRALAVQGLVAKLSGQARRRSEAAKKAWATRRKKMNTLAKKTKTRSTVAKMTTREREIAALEERLRTGVVVSIRPNVRTPSAPAVDLSPLPAGVRKR